MGKSIIIIGAGISGLSTGCYGQMNGYRTEIFESHNLPGGLCTSWKRKGYTFDGCIHWLAGSGSGGMHQIWEELGAVQDRKMINHKESGRIQRSDGKTLIMYTNVDLLERHMLELSPADKALIEEFCGLIRQFSKFDMPVSKPRELYSLLDYGEMMLHMLPFMKAWKKYTQISMRDFIMRFSDPLMREALLACFVDAGNYTMPDFPVVIAALMLAWYNTDNAGFPAGGSLEFARAIEQRYLSLGGTIQYKSRVKKVVVEGDTAVLLKSNYAYWKGMYSQCESYEAEKTAITHTVSAELERIYPGIERQIEVVDVTTPLTYERYTGSWQGSPQGWVTDLAENMGEGIPRTLPGLNNFYMVGQWVGDEGCPGAAMSGRNRVQLLCKKDGKKFKATKPAAAVLAGAV